MRLIVVPQSLSNGNKTAPQSTLQVVGIPKPSSQTVASVQHASSKDASLEAELHFDKQRIADNVTG